MHGAAQVQVAVALQRLGRQLRAVQDQAPAAARQPGRNRCSDDGGSGAGAVAGNARVQRHTPAATALTSWHRTRRNRNKNGRNINHKHPPLPILLHDVRQRRADAAPAEQLRHDVCQRRRLAQLHAAVPAGRGDKYVAGGWAVQPRPATCACRDRCDRLGAERFLGSSHALVDGGGRRRLRQVLAGVVGDQLAQHVELAGAPDARLAVVARLCGATGNTFKYAITLACSAVAAAPRACRLQLAGPHCKLHILSKQWRLPEMGAW